MSGTRRLWILGAVLALLVVWDLATWKRTEVVREAQPLFAPWTLAKVQGVRIESPESDLDPPVLVLQRGSTGQFKMQEHGEFPVRQAVAESLIRGLSTLTTLDLLSEDPASHERYGVQTEKGVRITVLGADQEVLADLIQGDLAPGGRARYVRRFDGAKVYRAPHFQQRVSVDWAPWIASQWMPVDIQALQSLHIRGGDRVKPLQLERLTGSRTQWETPEGRVWSQAKVMPVLKALSRVTITALEGPEPEQGNAAASDWKLDPGTLHFELKFAGDIQWSGYLAPATLGEESSAAGESELGVLAGVERDAWFRVRVAAKASGLLRHLIGKW